MDLKIATFNVNSILERVKRIAVISFPESVKADIIMVQKLHSRPHQEKSWQKEWKRGQALFHSNTENENTAGVVFLVNPSRVYMEKMNSDLQGRILTIKLLIYEHQYQIVNIYAPAGTDKRVQNEIFFDNLCPYINSTLPVIIGVDFNCVENPNLDEYPLTLASPKPDTLFDLRNNLNLIDTFCSLNPTATTYTRHAYNSH